MYRSGDMIRVLNDILRYCGIIAQCISYCFYKISSLQHILNALHFKPYKLTKYPPADVTATVTGLDDIVKKIIMFTSADISISHNTKNNKE